MMRRALLTLFCVVVGSGTALAEEAKCCFKNASYSGVCEVTPATDETCGSILQYLNTPNSVGKSYCGGTSIRGGWELVSCKSEPKGQAAAGGECEAAQASPAPRVSTAGRR
jgi:hypothetical protein